MQKKILATIIVLIVFSSTVFVAAVSAAPSANARPISIGLVAPVSKSPVGQDMYRAAQLAVKEINDAGGVHVAEWNTNVNITLDLADTVDDAPGNAVSPVTRAVTVDNVDMLIGGYGSAGTLANEVVAIENKVPYIISGASNQLVTRRGPQGNYGGLSSTDPQAITDSEGMSYVFHYCTTTYHYSKTVVDFFANVMKPIVAPDRNFNLAILFRDDAFGNGVEQATKYWIANESLPITILSASDLKYPTTTTDFQTQLTQIKGDHPDAVFVVDNPDRTPIIVKQGLNDVGLKTVYIAVENNEDPMFYSLIGQSGDSQLLESKFAPYAGAYLPDIQPYVSNFNATYGVIPGMMGADTYDAFYIAKAAIEQAGTLDKVAVRAAIEQTNLDDMLIITQTGKIQFSTGVNYHEINPVTFIEQLQWNATLNQCTPKIVWPASVSGVGTIQQAEFTLPAEYPLATPSSTPSSSSTSNTTDQDSSMIYIAAAIAVVIIIAIVAAVFLKKRKK